MGYGGTWPRGGGCGHGCDEGPGTWSRGVWATAWRRGSPGSGGGGHGGDRQRCLHRRLWVSWGLEVHTARVTQALGCPCHRQSPAASLTQNFLQTRGPPSRPAPAPPGPRVRALLPRPPCRAPCWRRAVTIRGRRAPHCRIGRPPLTRCDGHRVPGPAPGRGNPSAPRPAPRRAEQLGCVGGSAADQGQGGGAGPPGVAGKRPRPSLPEPEPAARDAGPAVTEQLAGGPGGLEGRAGGGASWVRHLGCRNKALLTAGCALPGPSAPVPEAGALTGRGRGWGSPGLSPARAGAICPAVPTRVPVPTSSSSWDTARRVRAGSPNPITPAKAAPLRGLGVGTAAANLGRDAAQL